MQLNAIWPAARALAPITPSSTATVANSPPSTAEIAPADQPTRRISTKLGQCGRARSENTPKLRTFDARGFRRDEVEFHPAYHELMAHSAHAGIHNSTWTDKGDSLVCEVRQAKPNLQAANRPNPIGAPWWSRSR